MVVPGDVVVVVVGGCVNLVFVVDAMVVVVEVGVGSKSKMVWNISCKRSLWIFVKFIYSEKATKFCEISTLLMTICTVVKSNVEIS